MTNKVPCEYLGEDIVRKISSDGCLLKIAHGGRYAVIRFNQELFLPSVKAGYSFLGQGMNLLLANVNSPRRASKTLFWNHFNVAVKYLITWSRVYESALNSKIAITGNLGLKRSSRKSGRRWQRPPAFHWNMEALERGSSIVDRRSCYKRMRFTDLPLPLLSAAKCYQWRNEIKKIVSRH